MSENIFEQIAKTKNRNVKPDAQLWLFEEFKKYFPEEKPKKQLDSLKLFHFANNIAAGMSNVEAYRKAYDTKTNNLNTQYVAACRLAKHPKVRLMVQDIVKRAEKTALMSKMEALRLLSESARSNPKPELRQAAQIKVLEAYGVFDKDKTQEMPDTFIFKVILPDGTEYKPVGKEAKAK